MDLGIKGKRAIVCASSKGLGLGCARALASAGVDLPAGELVTVGITTSQGIGLLLVLSGLAIAWGRRGRGVTPRASRASQQELGYPSAG